jgi:ATP-dependent helicase/nuclease subunit A
MDSDSQDANTQALKTALIRTERAQRIASDPTTSAWVSANAGTGKTYVLTSRVLRLLLAGTQPERILALTFTKAAAAEMSKRVFDRLGTWVTAPPAALARMLSEILGREPKPDELKRARQLFALAIETPGGLKVQTIHGFCERLLKRFPLEAGVPPHFKILDEVTAAALLREVVDRALMKAANDPNGSLGCALQVAISYAVDDGFDDVLRDALRHRSWLAGLGRLAAEASGVDPIDAVYRRALDLPNGLDADHIDAAMAAVMDEPALSRAVSVLSAGKSTDKTIALALAEARAAKDVRARGQALQSAFLTKEQAPRSDARFITKDIRKAEPALTEALTRARDALPILLEQRNKLTALAAILALVTLANAVLTDYQATKASRAALDFDDLIAKTASLLSQSSEGGGATPTQWVLYKLDGGLDHILVDEAQDTSPEQWAVVSALAAEFFSDSAGRDVLRTLFAVGDEKQSIYGFQGAAPEMFKAMGKKFYADAVAVSQPLARVPLNVSFRTTSPVLAAVDIVFADATRVPGVATHEEGVKHIAFRTGQAGVVEVWPTEKPIDAEKTDTWEPNGEQSVSSAVARLANRIGDCIGRWLAQGEVLQSEGRPIRPADILILVRRRRPFAPAMVAALKARGIPVAGADRITLTDQIVVQDLMVLGDFLTMPEDDLALATTLKSPLFGLDDDDLMVLAYERKGQLWTALLAEAKLKPRLLEAAGYLRRWRSEADFMPPYEFYTQLLDRDNGLMRKRMLTRLGAEATDPLDEFLNQALKYDDSAPASLTGFLAALRASGAEIKRDMDQGRNEVRVMTVHGAKGLEAPIVFLPDTCSARSGGMPGALLALAEPPLPIGVDKLMLWPVKNTKAISPVVDARAAAKCAEQSERNRLLYVALTRPRDRLYITGYEGRHAPSLDSWYAQVQNSLQPFATTELCADGSMGLRLASKQVAAPTASMHGADHEVVSIDVPAWAAKRAKSETRISVPLAPSRLAPLETDENGEPVSATRSGSVEPQAFASAKTIDQVRFLRGTLTHALLQHLPDLPQQQRLAGARRFLEVRGLQLTKEGRASIVRDVFAVLDDAKFAPLFGPESQAEIPIVAELERPEGKGTPIRLNGQIDRLARVGREILIVDYKTNRPSPMVPEDVAEAYLLQLAAYRLALGKIYPGVAVKSVILWTERAHLMEIPGTLLDAAEKRLWALDFKQSASAV